MADAIKALVEQIRADLTARGYPSGMLDELPPEYLIGLLLVKLTPDPKEWP